VHEDRARGQAEPCKALARALSAGILFPLMKLAWVVRAACGVRGARQHSAINAKIAKSKIFLRWSLGARSAVTSMMNPFFSLSPSVPTESDAQVNAPVRLTPNSPVASSDPTVPNMPRVSTLRERFRTFPLQFAWIVAIHFCAQHCCMRATVAQSLPQLSAPLAAPAEDVASDATALDAYLLARAWLDADSLPAESSAAARVDLGPTTAVCAILRFDGRLVGAGEAQLPRVGALRSDLGESTAAGSEGPTADAARLLLRRAVGRAVSKALSEGTIDAVRREMGDKVTARLSLEIELAGTPRPLIGRTIAEACRRLVVGDEGVAVIRDGAIFRAFPSRLLAADVASRPDRTIAGLLIEAGLPVKDLHQYAPEDRVSLARFPTIRLRGTTPTAIPGRVTRAGRVVELQEISGGQVESLVGQLANRLAAQVVPRDPRAAAADVMLLGTLNPTKDVYEPIEASARDAALAVLALGRAANSSQLPQSIRDHARDRALVLARAQFREGDAATVDAAAAYLLAAAVESFDDASLARAAADRARAARAASADGVQDAPSSAVLEVLRALSLLATEPTTGPADAEAIVAKVRASVAGLDVRLIDAALPLALVLTHPRASEETRRDVAATLSAIATLSRRIQIVVSTDEFRDVSPDVDGGLMLPGVSIGIPDTQCLPLAAALAIAHPLLDPSDEPDRRAATVRFVRFLAQHVATDPWIGGLRNPNAARGLVRASLVGDDCPIGATSAGLLLAEAALASTPTRPAPGEETANSPPAATQAEPAPAD
jgi:hypothetical protein